MLRFEQTRMVQGSFSLDADFSVAQGARVAVTGPSGSGKSTLIGAVAGFVPLAAGAIGWQGERIDTLAPAKRPMSILFQDNNLLPHLSVFDNVALGRSPDLRLTDADRAALGPALKRDMLDLVAQIATEQNATLMMITHDPADALRICEQTIVVADGSAAAPEDTAALLNFPIDALAAYLG